MVPRIQRLPYLIIGKVFFVSSRKKQEEVTQRLHILEEVWDRYDVYDKKNG